MNQLYVPSSTGSQADWNRQVALAVNSIIKLLTTGIGYTEGVGGSVTQTTNKGNPVTLDAICGKIVMHNASLAANTTVGFPLNNSFIAADDVLIVNISGAVVTGNTYLVGVEDISAGQAIIRLRNASGTARAEAVELNFAIIKSVTS